MSATLLSWFESVLVPIFVVLLPLFFAFKRQVQHIDKRNTDQHSDAMAQRASNLNSIQHQLDNVLHVATDTNRLAIDTNRKIDQHLRDHHQGDV